MKKVAIVYARFGPYHIARLRAAHDHFSQLGWSVIGIEICPDDKFYPWNHVESPNELCRIPVMPGRLYQECSRKEIQIRMFEILDTELPDMVALPGWYYAEAMAGLRWCLKNKRIPILMSESSQHDAKRVWWQEWIKKLRVQQFAAAVVGGGPHAQYLTKLGMESTRIFYGHNVVDNDYFDMHSDTARASDAELRLAFRLPDRYILASGRFIPVKNFMRLLQAYRLYYDEVGATASPLVLCGDGKERPNIEKGIRNLSLQSKVILPGFVQYEDLPIYYGLASVFVQPSIVEPWGLVVNEAMAAGLPVLVSSRCGCASDLVYEGINGFTFDPTDVHQLANLIIHFDGLNDRLTQMGQASREIISNWRPNQFAEGLQKAIQSVTSSEGNMLWRK